MPDSMHLLANQPRPRKSSRTAARLRRHRLGPRLGYRHCRGSIYAVVLGVAILVSLVGLSAVAVGRVNLGTVRLTGDGADSDVLALSAVEHAAAVVNTDPNWRNNYTSGVESAPKVLGRGSFTWKLVDEADASLPGALQPVRVYGTGRVGEARRCYSVLLTPGGTNLFTNPGFESGTTGYEVQAADCVIEPSVSDVRNGTRSLQVRSRVDRTAGPQTNLTSKVVSGNSYYAEAWIKMSVTAEDPWLCLVIKQAGYPDTPFKVRGQTGKVQEWTRVTGTLSPTWTGTADAVYFRIETNSTLQDYKLDDLKIVESAGAPPMAPAAETWRQEALP